MKQDLQNSFSHPTPVGDPRNGQEFLGAAGAERPSLSNELTFERWINF